MRPQFHLLVVYWVRDKHVARNGMLEVFMMYASCTLTCSCKWYVNGVYCMLFLPIAYNMRRICCVCTMRGSLHTYVIRVFNSLHVLCGMCLMCSIASEGVVPTFSRVCVPASRCSVRSTCMSHHSGLCPFHQAYVSTLFPQVYVLPVILFLFFVVINSAFI